MRTLTSSASWAVQLTVVLVVVQATQAGEYPDSNRGTANSLEIPAEGEVPAAIAEFLDDRCVYCHDGSLPDTSLDLTELAFEISTVRGMEKWVKILDRVDHQEMPPPSEGTISADDRLAFTSRLNEQLLSANEARYASQGRTMIRRLNRHEYEQTLHDLLEINVPLKGILPEETPLHGFDTVSDGLRFSALHVSKYLEAADVALDAAIRFDRQPEMIDTRIRFVEQDGIRRNIDEQPDGRSVCRDIGNAAVLFTDASHISKIHGVRIREPGLYRIKLRGWAFQSDRPVILRMHAGHYSAGTKRVLGYFDMPPNTAREVEMFVHLEHSEYLYPAPDDLVAPPDNSNIWGVGGESYEGSGLALEWIEIEGPLLEVWPPESVKRVFGEVPIEPLARTKWEAGKFIAYAPSPTDPINDVKEVVESFARRAFRRPLRDAEAEPFQQLAVNALEAGRSFEEAVRIGLRAILVSPQFLILEESPGRLSGYALASRLSYAFWGTHPDIELLTAASQQSLQEPSQIAQQVDRLLEDPRSSAFIESFIGQWLDLRRIDATNPDPRLYPEFDDLLRISMLEESHQYFRSLVNGDRPIEELIDADYVLINRRLADHYQIDGVSGQQFRRVELPEGSPRGGVLTQASILKVTANGTVTSPVLRGTWVQSRLLNQPPPPPPPGVGSVEPDIRGATTIREQLAKHRNNRTCAACHDVIDPPGFALESFDAIGGWRDRYRSQNEGDRPEEKLHGRDIWEYKLGPAVDASGETVDGTTFSGIEQYKQILLQQRESVYHSLTENLFVYFTGHQIELADREEVGMIVDKAMSENLGLRSLIHEIVQSRIFRHK